ncbi:glycosyltransferase [Methylocaldum sp.]|uniref:glycosyltransferase family 4 protein n=1 Tax=Methylocaldum sp. TaxID=1969727 RepID=UPI002D42E650|nr:glycosyltransferase [Methylocaldum sp.]HYE36907.1 glycosyltransferase [Methylocaldum sp.]
MKLVFVHPPLDACPSGGNVFNRHVIDRAVESGFPLETMAISSDGAMPTFSRLPRDSIILWDSLLLESLSNCPLVQDGPIHGFLAHYVPFLNPLLDADRRKEEKDRFERAAERVQFFIATGLSIQRLLERLYPGKPVFLCEPGVDAAFLAARQASAEPTAGWTIQIATVANLLPAKGLTELLEILAKLQHYCWAWHLVGDDRTDPGYTERFRSRIAELGLQTRITRHGVLDTPKLAQLLGAMDIFAFASRFEAYGMALAEAAAVGLPIVTTAVGEASRIVQHGKTGFVAPIADPDAFRDGLEQLLSDHELRRRCRSRLLLNTPRTWDAAFADFGNAIRTVCATAIELERSRSP